MPIVVTNDNAATYTSSLCVSPIANLIELPSGRKLYRHPTLPGSVLMFNDGQDRQVLVLDAKYRNDLQFFNQVITIPNIVNVTAKDSTTTYIDIKNSLGTDEVFNNFIQDPETSRSNTEIFNNAYSKTVSFAAPYCRSITIGDGLVCDLPNINTLMRIACDAFYIDELDPTMRPYVHFSLYNCLFQKYSCSSSQFDDEHIWYVNSRVDNNNPSTVESVYIEHNQTKLKFYTVVPVYEL